jgi:hypothetical protein
MLSHIVHLHNYSLTIDNIRNLDLHYSCYTSFILVFIMPMELQFIHWPSSLPSALGFIIKIRDFYSNEGPYCDLVTMCSVVHGCQQFGET